jgi:hypothetical protein
VDIICAECGCIVDRGVRLAPCDSPECCYKRLPIREGDEDQEQATDWLK